MQGKPIAQKRVYGYYQQNEQGDCFGREIFGQKTIPFCHLNKK